MKKYILSLIAAVAVVGCTTFKDEASIPVVNPSDPTIAVNEVGDNGFSFTVSAAEGTGFYSYAVLKGTAQVLNPTNLLKVQYKSGPACGTVDAAVSNPVKVDVEGLDFNTTYTIYAVAASAQGTVGKVVSKEVLTTDTLNPSPTTYSRNGNVITLTFSEAVTYKTFRTPTVKYYAVNNAVIAAGELVKDGFVGEGEAAVAVSGKTATFTVTLDGTNPLPDGAYFTISYPEGAFVDALENKIPAITSAPGVTSAGALGFKGIYGRIANKAFELEDVVGKATVAPGETEIAFGIPAGVTVYDFTEDADASITVESEETSKTVTTVYSLDEEEFLLDEAKVTLVFPAGLEANPGDNLTFTVAEASIEDIYGNTNAAFETEYLFSYGFTIADIAGTYMNAGASGYGAAYNEPAWTFTIAESDDATEGNVMVTNYYGLDTKIYADFDYDTGIFTMPLYFEYINGEIDETEGTFTAWYTFGYYSCQKDEKNDLVLAMTESGVFTGANDYLGYYYEVYAMPESGNVEDIDEDNDFITYDYNIFRPVPMSKVVLAGAPAKKSAQAVREMPLVEKTVVKRIAK